MVLFLVLFSFLPFLFLEVVNGPEVVFSLNAFFLVELLSVMYGLAGSFREGVAVILFPLNFFLEDFFPDLTVKPSEGAFRKVYTG